jgi:beta-aspartyl-dipeptidase (metallo-type)
LRLTGRGSIEVGSAADLIALEATGAIGTVIIGGRMHVRAGKPVVRGPFEP